MQVKLDTSYLTRYGDIVRTQAWLYHNGGTRRDVRGLFVAFFDKKYAEICGNGSLIWSANGQYYGTSDCDLVIELDESHVANILFT